MMRPGFRLGGAIVVGATLAVACSAPQNGASLYQGPDRPDDEAVLGPAPPTDYNFGPTRREVDTDGDRRRDHVEFVSDGAVIGVGDDTNHDGKIDRYRKLSHGMVIDETRDTNFDGILDLRAYDTDNDGQLDKEIQLSAPLNGEILSPPSPPPPRVPPSSKK